MLKTLALTTEFPYSVKMLIIQIYSKYNNWVD